MISIIIPTLNEEKLLPKLLDQLSEASLKQKYQYEIIISDGGSKDKTIEIAKKYTDKIIIHNKPVRQKISEGKNQGYKLATGDILVFLCADCRIDNLDKFFSYLYEFKNSKFEAATFWFEVFPEEQKISDKIFHFFNNWYIWMLNKIFNNGMGRGECQVVKKNIFEKLNGFNEELVGGEDYDFYTRIKKNGNIDINFSIKVYESPRRYRKYGYLRILWLWFKNSLRVFNLIKSQPEEWIQIR